MQKFRHALEVNGLYDLGWRGQKFTWTNWHEDENFTKERLDRTGGEKDWANVVQNAWNAVSRDHALGNGFNDRFNNCIRALLKWNQQLHKNVPQELEQKLSLLQQFQREANSDNVTTIKSLKDEISKLLAQEDLKRRQRAERNWYNLGNKNTKFFHACDTQ